MNNLNNEMTQLITDGGTMQMVDYSPAPQQIVYLDFDGEDTQYRNDVLDITLSVNVENSGLSVERIGQITEELNKKYSEKNIKFVSDLSYLDDDDVYSTVYVGKTSAFDGYGDFLGLAETIDVGNQIYDDNAFVIMNTDNTNEEIISVVSHEVGHIAEGMNHEYQFGTLSDYAAGTTKNLGAVSSFTESGTLKFGDAYYYNFGVTSTGYYKFQCSVNDNYVHARLSNGYVTMKYLQDTDPRAAEAWEWQNSSVFQMSNGTYYVYLEKGQTYNLQVRTIPGGLSTLIDGDFSYKMTKYEYVESESDSVAPVISNVSLTQGANNYVFTASVTATDNKTTVTNLKYKIKYATTKSGLNSATARSGISFTLDSTAAGKTYYYQVGVTDEAGNTAWSTASSFAIASVTSSSSDEGVVVESGSFLGLSNGKILNGATVDAGGWLDVSSGGTAKQTTVNGYISVSSGGIASNTAVNFGGEMLVHNNGVANSITLSSGGEAFIYCDGMANSAIVSSGGYICVESGGTATNAKITSGGRLGVYLNSNTLFTGTSNGSSFRYAGVVSGQVIENTKQFYVCDGAIVNDTTVNGGMLSILNNGIAISTVVNESGELRVSSGGTTNIATVTSGGSMNVGSGGTATTTKITSGGSMRVRSGGILRGITDVGGVLTMSGVANATGATINFALEQRKTSDTYIINDISLISGASYTITVSTTQAEGTYQLAQGAATFNQTITLKNTSGTTLGTLIVGNTTSAGGMTYTLSKSSANLALEISSSNTSTYSGEIISSGCSLILSSGSVVNSAMVNANGYMYVENGGTVSNTIVNANGFMYVKSGGTANSTTLDGSMYVSSCGTANNTILNYSGHVCVRSGGTANNATVNSHGYLGVDYGGTATNVKIASGGWMRITLGNNTLYEGTSNGSSFRYTNFMSGCIVDYTKTLHVSSGGTASNVSVGYMGLMKIGNGGIANSTTVCSKGSMQVSENGIANNVIVSSGGSMCVLEGGVLHGVTNVGGTLKISYGTANATGATVNFALEQRKTSDTYIINDISLISGASYTITVSTTQTEGTYQLAQGAATFNQTITLKNTSGTTLGALSVGNTVTVGGRTYTLSRSSANLSLGISSASSSSSTTSTYNGEVVSSGCTLNLSNGAIANNTTVNYDGWLNVCSGGTANSTIVKNGGYAYVYSKGNANKTTVQYGGNLTVCSGGSATSTTVNSGGKIDLESGGTATDMTIAMGGEMGIVLASNTLFAGTSNGSSFRYGSFCSSLALDTTKFLTVEMGGTASYTSVNSKGFLYVNDGGTVSNTTLNASGSMFVYNKGTANSTTVTSGGYMYLGTGGSAIATKITSGGSMRVWSGGILRGITDVGGLLTMSGAVDASNATINFALEQRETSDTYIINDISLISGASYTITVSTTQAEGTYQLAQGAATFNQTITLKNTSGTTLGTMSVGKTINAGGKSYTLSRSSATLALEISSASSSSSTTSTYNGKVISSGCTLTLSNGTVANSTTVLTGGEMRVCSGGTANITTVNSEGFLRISGGTANNVTLKYDGFMYIEDGTANNVLVMEEGCLYVIESGSIARDTTVNYGGEIYVYNGGILRGLTNVGGTLWVTGIVTDATSATINFALEQRKTTSDIYIINNISLINGASYTITVGTTQTEGTYQLAGGASNFNQTITLKNTSGTTLGTLSVGNSVVAGGKTYSLSQSGGILSFTVATGSVVTDTVAPVISSVSLEQGTADYTFTARISASDNKTAVTNLKYQIKYSTSTSGLNTATAQSGKSFTLNASDAGKTYYYQVGVADEAGNTTWSDIAEFTVQDVTGPTIKSCSLVQDVSDYDFTANIEATDNITATANLKYQIKYATSSSGLSTATAQSGKSFALDSTYAEKYIYYQVGVTDETGITTWSNAKSLYVIDIEKGVYGGKIVASVSTTAKWNMYSVKSVSVKRDVSYTACVLRMSSGKSTVSIANGGTLDVTSISADGDATRTTVSAKDNVSIAIHGSMTHVEKFTTGKNAVVNVEDVYEGVSSAKNTLTFGNCSTVTMEAGMKGINKLTLGNGTAANIKKGLLEQYSALETDEIEGTSFGDTLSFGNYSDVNLTGDVDLSSGGSDTVKIGNYSEFNSKDIKFSDDTKSKNTFNLGTASMATVGNILNVNKVTLSNGVYDKKSGDTTYTELTATTITGSTFADTLSFGNYNYVDLSGNVDLSEGGSDTLKIGNYSEFYADNINFSDAAKSKNTFNLGTASTATVGNILNVNKVTLSKGIAANAKKYTPQSLTHLVATEITGSTFGDTLSFGNDSKTEINGDVSLGDGNDTLKIGNYAEFNANTVNFGAGNDTLSIGKTSVVEFFEVNFGDGNAKSKDAITIGSLSTVTLGYITDVNKITVSNGTAANAKKGLDAAYTELITGDITGTDNSDTLSFGNYVQVITCDIDFGEGNDTLKLGSNTSVEIQGSLDFGDGAKDALSIGKGSTVSVDELDVENLEKLTMSKDSKLAIGDADDLADAKEKWAKYSSQIVSKLS